MFNHTHYVPVLRYKKSEQIALLNLSINDRVRITPILEISPNLLEPKKIKDKQTKQITLQPVKIEDVFPKVIPQIQSFWGELPFFADFELLEKVLKPKQKHPAEIVCDAAIEAKMPMVFVTGLNRSTRYDYIGRQYIQRSKKGLCLRITSKDLKDDSLTSSINSLLSSYDLSLSQVDLVVDLKLIQNNYLGLWNIIKTIPKINSWRSFTVLSGAHPKDLSELEKNQEHELERSDWQYWFKQIGEPGLKRKPTFGDYTIQHPLYDFNPPQNPNVSASIRYTSDDYWVVMRGEGLRNDNGAGFEQYWGHASNLSNRPEYCGKDFSYGDELIYKIANQIGLKGNPKTLLCAGINHHLVFTTRQIAKMFGISNKLAPKDAIFLGPRPGRDVNKRGRGVLSGSRQPFLFSPRG